MISLCFLCDGACLFTLTYPFILLLTVLSKFLLVMGFITVLVSYSKLPIQYVMKHVTSVML